MKRKEKKTNAQDRSQSGRKVGRSQRSNRGGELGGGPRRFGIT